MTIEVMKQALEALESIKVTVSTSTEANVIDGVDLFPKEITALRQAIEQAEKQEPVAFRNRETGEFCTGGFLRKDWAKWQPLYTAPVHASDMSQKRVDETAKCGHDWGLVTDDALIEEVRRRGFTIRDAQISSKREWVGLTDGEVHDAFNFVEFIKQISFDRDRPEWCENFAAYIEAKLKEKNGG